MRKVSSFSALIFTIIFVFEVVIAFAAFSVMINAQSVFIGVFAFIVSLFVSLAIKAANQREQAVVLRLGKFPSPKGPGLFLIIPINEYALRSFKVKLNYRNSTGFGGGYSAA